MKTFHSNNIKCRSVGKLHKVQKNNCLLCFIEFPWFVYKQYQGINEDHYYYHEKHIQIYHTEVALLFCCSAVKSLKIEFSGSSSIDDGLAMVIAFNSDH